MTKVVYIVSDIDKAVFFEHTALRMRDAGIDLSFILINSRNGALASFLQQQGFRVYFIEVGKLIFSWRQIFKSWRILRRERPDAVHCHLAQANFIGLISSFFAGVRIRIFTRHAGKPLMLSRKEAFIDKLQNMLATRIVAITQVIKDLLIEQGVSERKITIVHHGFDIDRMMRPDPSEVRRIKQQYNPDNKYPVVGVIARWMKWKGIQYTIPAFERLLKEYPDARLYLFNASNNCDYSAEIAEMLQKLPKESYQTVPFEKNIYDLYHLFDLYVHVPVNPYCEAFGQTYVEALAAGIPSVFTLSGIAREFITDENAYVVDFENSEQIYQKMKAILLKEKDPEKLISNGQAVVLRMFTVEKYMATLLPLYK
jgi:glycosyltransferase involved in cell wall biosynthesis